MNDEIRKEARFWVGVASASHVSIGVQGGFAQLNHGKAAPLRKMSVGDWMVYYSPRSEMHRGVPLHAFTAIGCMTDEKVYAYPMSDQFVPFRRNVQYLPCRTVKIRDILNRLSFTQHSSHWGSLFRRGHFEIERKDFLVIAQSMTGEEWL